ncbi:MAG: DUF445 domain-containing protein [Planctomycetota bacterium]|jgi:uncharacterized membrane-anchored protein YjiN (DUF445 family)
MNKSERKPVVIERDKPSRGSGMLAFTGVSLSLLTLAGAVLRWQMNDAFWTQVFFAVAIGGLVGFATNWLAIKMLFHPRVKLLGIQGVVPSRRKELARSVGRVLEDHLISGDRIHQLLVDSGAVEAALDALTIKAPALLRNPEIANVAVEEITGLIEYSVLDVVGDAKDMMKEKASSNVAALLTGGAAAASFGPMGGVIAAGVTKSGMLNKLVDKMIDDLIEDMRESGKMKEAARAIAGELPDRTEKILADAVVRQKLGELSEQLSETLLAELDVASLVEGELLAHDDEELENLIDDVAANELGFIQIAGGILGMIAGLSFIWPWMVAPLGLAFLLAVQIARGAERRKNTTSGDTLSEPDSTDDNSSETAQPNPEKSPVGTAD